MPLQKLSILYNLLDAIKELNFSPERKEISDVVIKGLQSVFNLNDAFFYVIDESREHLMLELSTDLNDKKIYNVGEGYIGEVVQKDEIITFSKEIGDSTMQFIAAPARGKKNILGVIGGKRIGAPLTDNEKELLNLFGYQVGVTVESYIYHKRLLRSKEFRDTILLNIPSGILVINTDWFIKTYNRSAAILLKKDNLRGKKIDEIFPKNIFLKALKDVFERKIAIKNIEIESGTGEYFNIGLVPLFEDLTVGDVLMIIDDITELRRAIQDKERADRMVLIGQLSAGIAHEIRNPITGINISLEMLKDAENITDSQKRIVDKILKELSDIEELINALLEISKPQSVKLKQENLVDFIGDFVVRVKEMADKKNIKIICHNKSDAIMAHIDSKKLNQVFMNLFKNSLEALPDGGIIEISLEEKVDSIKISFKDRGTGIKKDIIDKIYEPFYTTKKGGTGLGLYLCKAIIEAHNGRIDVKSDGESFTEFLISIPKIKRV